MVTKHDFRSVLRTIKEYYPIENPDGFDEESVRGFTGVERMEEIVYNNFYIQKNYRERWGGFRKFLKKGIKEHFRETMIAFYPCYSGVVTLKAEKFQEYTLRKEVHIYISLLGPYYTIVGVDRAEMESLDGAFSANMALTVSPFLEFGVAFLNLQEKISDYFPDFKFVPYRIGKRELKGISLVNQSHPKQDTVFSALFRPEDLYYSKVRGDERYGYDDWKFIQQSRL